MNYYRRYVGDYLRDTARLSMLEHGAYNLLLDYYYAEERPIPADLTEVYRMVRAIMPDERRAVVKVLTTFFTNGEQGYRHKRVDEEIAKGTSAIDQMSDAGRRGAETRWGQRKGADAGGDRVPHRKRVKTHGVDDAGGDATTNHQPPTASLLTTNHQPPAKHCDADARRAAAEDRATRSRPARHAYSVAYERRWKVEPTWDKQANSVMAQFVEKVGIDDAPGIAEFYLGHNRQDYVRSKHDVILLLRDARGLRTEWQTGRKVTDTEARQADRTAATGAAFTDLLLESGESA